MQQIRSEIANSKLMGQSVPCDVFALGYGEPKRRDVTKINGLPYRPAKLHWPLRQDTGEPMTFFAQFRFKESSDFLPNLPGDILLIFAEEDEPVLGGEYDFFHFEWYPLGLDHLVTKEELPKPAWEFITCYGSRHRSVDYVDKNRQASKAVESFIPKSPRTESWYRRPMSSLVRWGDAVKIGGQPLFYEDDPAKLNRLQDELPGRFLCSIPVIWPLENEPDPWINQSEPYPKQKVLPPRTDYLYFWDGFILLYSIDEHGVIHWTIDLM